MGVTALVLAAGGSRRMGSPKQLLELEGRSLVRRAADAALGSRCSAVYVVVGAQAEAVAAEVRGTPARIISNPDWRAGLGGSIGVGVAAATLADQPDAILLMLADQPLVTSALLDDLAAALPRPDPTAIAACAYAGALGVPAIFGREHFGALCRLEGDRGARALLEANAARAIAVPFEGGAVDVDTPDDFARLSAPRAST